MNVAVSGKYEAYPEYKDSGVEWLGKVPKDWVVTKIGRLSIKIGSGKTPKGGSEIYSNKGVLFIRSQNVYDTGLVLDDVVYISKNIDEEMINSRVLNGDILLNITGASIGRTCKVPDGFCSANVNQHVCIVRMPMDYRDYISLFLKSIPSKAQIDAAQNGAAREGLNFEQLSNISVCFPKKIAEREKIATFLTQETTKIDTLIQKQQQLIKLLKEKRQAVISHAVTKGLNPNAPMRDSGVEWLGEVPEGWEVTQLKFKTLEMQTGPFGSQLHAEDYIDDGIPLINPAHMINGKILPDYKVTVDKETQSRLKRHKLSKGEIIFARRGELGRCAIVEKEQEGWLCGTGSLRAKLNISLKPEYAYLLITSDGAVSELSLESKGSTMDNLNTEILGRVRLPVPPVEEQIDILKYVEKISGKYSFLISKSELTIELMKERRTALISAAVTGKIDVRNFIPDPKQPSNAPKTTNPTHKEVAA